MAGLAVRHGHCRTNCGGLVLACSASLIYGGPSRCIWSGAGATGLAITVTVTTTPTINCATVVGEVVMAGRRFRETALGGRPVPASSKRGEAISYFGTIIGSTAIPPFVAATTVSGLGTTS